MVTVTISLHPFRVARWWSHYEGAHLSFSFSSFGIGEEDPSIEITLEERERDLIYYYYCYYYSIHRSVTSFFSKLKRILENVQGLTNKSIEFQSLFHRCYIHESSPIETLIKE